MEIFKEFRFEAAHRLPNLPEDHKCSRLHGHSFRIRIYVKGEVDAVTGWILDFQDIQKIFQPYYDMLDHRYLNDVPGLENPTSENPTKWIWDNIHDKLPGCSKIEVFETCTSGVTYYGT